MKTALRWTTALRAMALVIVPSVLEAQMTVTGSVSSGDEAVRGATVTIAELRLSTTTNVEGRYRFLIPTAVIRGQTVTIVARHSRYGTQSAQILIAGAPVEQDFVLARFERAPALDSVAAPVMREAAASRVVDSSAFRGHAGPVDLAQALAGRVPGLTATPGTAGGASRLLVRGPRSFTGTAQPLIVVDGAVVENESITTALQQFGLGGFDYGTPVQDIPLENIESATLLDPAAATALYGLRAANGVIVVTTRRAAVVNGLQLSGSLRYSGEKPLRLPAYQNSYGQGLGGQFEFFDGRGGGINDAVDQSWGPKLDGRPVAQGSYTAAERPEVRYWLPASSGIRDYFETGRTVDLHGAIGVTRPSISGRVALDARTLDDLRPDLEATRFGVSFSGTAQPSPKVAARASMQFTTSSANDRPGTGFADMNTVAGFTRMGRQVDLDSLRAHITAGSQQVNWIYTGKNNPFYQPLRNSNDDSRNQVLGGGMLRYAMGRGLSAELDAGVSDVREERNVDVVRGWLGTYPTALGMRDFSGGASEQRSIEVGERRVSLALHSAPRRRLGMQWAGTAGVSQRANTFSVTSVVTDTVTVRDSTSAEVTVRSLFLFGTTSRGENLSLDWGLRAEDASSFSDGLGLALFPSLALNYDIGRQMPSLRQDLKLGEARVRASWWRAGNEVGPRTLRLAYAGGGTASDPALRAGTDSVALPERTTGTQVSAALGTVGGRVGLDLSVYRELTREAFVAAPGVAASAGEIANTGVEGQIRVQLPTGAGDARRWDVALVFARNANTVRELGFGLQEVALSPSFWGASLVARTDEPFGVITGTRFLRDSATGKLVLRNGLPIADASGVVDLGTIQPDWSFGVTNRLRFGSLELSVLLDARVGGRVFSATNLWGSYAGTLESTVPNRETGVVTAGVDSATARDTTMTVSAEDYYHALGAIHEAWVYDASWWKLRDARLTYSFALRFVPGFRSHVLRASLVGRNLASGSRAPNIDPESVLSTVAFRGFELGQHPTTRSIGIQLSVTP